MSSKDVFSPFPETREAGGGLPRRGLVSTLAWGGTGAAGALAAAASGRTAVAVPGDGEVPVDRGFVRIREGLVHYRTAGSKRGRRAPPPLYMVHGGPGSSRGLEPFLRALGRDRRVIAPDTLGYGDSAAPDIDQPEIEDYADSVKRILDALDLETVDFYGSHTGVHIGCELALRHPRRVRKLIFDGITFFSPQEREDYLRNYAPAKRPDKYGSQLDWAWHFVRDMALFFPHFATDAAHRLDRGVPSPEALHNSVLDVLKALTTYHLTYNAVFRHDLQARLPLLAHPVLCITSESDPNIRYLDGGAALIKHAETFIVKAGGDRGAGRMREFLDA
jgi:pimeloyl-ACP methyl ester carboxylesterase